MLTFQWHFVAVVVSADVGLCTDVCILTLEVHWIFAYNIQYKLRDISICHYFFARQPSYHVFVERVSPKYR